MKNMYCFFIFIFIASLLSAQEGECLSGGCSGGVQWPSSEFSTNSDTWTIVSTALWPGEYSVYNVVNGKTYEWSLCPDDGGEASYDSQLTLLSYDGTQKYCYSDDVCGLDAKIKWTATYTGKVRVLVNEHYCASNTENFTTIVWRCVSCDPVDAPDNNICSGAINLTVNEGETCSVSTSGDVSGATGSNITDCFGTANNDVWYKFTAADSYYHVIEVIGSSGFDAVVELREGPDCNGTHIMCADATGTGGKETIFATGLTSGQTYYVRVYDYFSSEPSTTTFDICITTPETCTPFYSMGTGSGDYIDGVELIGEDGNNIENLGTGPSDHPYYVDFSEEHSADLKAGFSYTLEITNGSYGGQTLVAWIDFNNDGIFQESEKIGEITNVEIEETVTIEFTVPQDAVIGGTIMRVRAVWSQTDIDPCENYSFGEAEDYGINIISPCEIPGPPTNLSVIPGETSASFTWEAPNDPAGTPPIYYYWAVSTSETITGWFDANIVEKDEAGTSLSGSTTIELSPGTDYWLHMFAKTSCDNWVEASDWVSEPFTTTCTTPGIPQETETTNISTTSVTLNWEEGDPEGTQPVTYYWAVNTSSTVDYEDNNVQSGTTTNLSVNVYNLTLNTDYYWTVKAVTDCGSGSESLYTSTLSFTTLAVPTPLITWTGNNDTDWDNTSNWNPEQVPTIDDNVIIPGGCDWYPILFVDSGDPEVALRIGGSDWAAKYKCKSLTIDPDASITIYRVPGATTDFAYVNVYDVLDISGDFYYNPTFYSNTFRIFSGGNVYVRNGGLLTVGMAPGTTDNEFPDIDMTGGILNLDPGGIIIITDELRFQSGVFNMHGGELWIKYHGGGSIGTYGFNIYQNAELNITSGDVYICGQRNDSSLRMIDWNANADINISGGTIHIVNNQVGSNNNLGYINFKGHKIHNLIINRDDANSYLATNTDNVIISGDLLIEEESAFYANNLNFISEGNIINDGAFYPGTGTVELKGTNKEIKGSSQTSFNNLTITEDASYTINHTHSDTWIPVNGNFEMESGSSLTIKSGKQLSLGGNAIINGNITAENVFNGAVDVGLNGNYNISGSGIIIADIRTTSGTRTQTSNLAINGDFLVSSGAGFTMTTHTLSVAGDWINSGIFTRGTGSVVLAGSNKLIGGSQATAFYNLFFNEDAKYELNTTGGWPNERIEVYNTFELGNNAELNLANGKRLSLFSSINTVNGKISNSTGIYPQYTSPTGNFDIYIRRDNTLSGNGVIDANVLFFKDAQSSITSLDSDFEVKGSVGIWDEAELHLGSNKLSVGGNWSNAGSGVFNAGTGTVYFNGEANRTIDAGGIRLNSTGKAFYNLKVDCSDYKLSMINTPLEIDNNFEILSGTFETGTGEFAYRLRAGNKEGGSPKGTTIIHENATLFVNYHTHDGADETYTPVRVPNLFGNFHVYGSVETSRPIKSGYNDLVIQSERIYAPGEINGDIQIYSHYTNPVLQIGDVNINGDLIIQSTNGWLNQNPNNVLTIEGNLCIYKYFKHNGTVNVHGNIVSYNNEVDINLENSTFNIFTEDSDKHIYLTANPIIFHNINFFSELGTREIRQNIFVTGNLNIESGKIDVVNTGFSQGSFGSTQGISNATITLGGNSSWMNNGTFISREGKVSFTGNSAQVLGGSSITDFYNLEINKTGDGSVSLQNIANVSNSLLLSNGNFNTSATRYINILDLAGTNPEGGQSNSFVNGPVRKTGRNSDDSYGFIFPTGKNGNWARIEMQHDDGTTSNTDAFTAEYFDTPYSNLNTDFCLEHVSLVEYWLLSKNSGNENLAKKIKLYSENKEDSGILEFDSDLSVAHYNSSEEKWQDIGNTQTSSSGSAGWVISGSHSDFSPFTFSSKEGDNPLPVTLLNFDANIQDEQVITHWSTASEYNTDYFLVQKSNDLIGFKDVGIVQATGFSNEVRNYSLIDEDLWTGITYYRLKSVDFDNTYSYSNIVAVEYAEQDKNQNEENVTVIGFVNLFPNPVVSELNLLINSIENTSVKIQIIDLRGKLLYSDILHLTKGNNNTSLDVNYLSEGFYIISIISRDGRVSEKIIKWN